MGKISEVYYKVIDQKVLDIRTTGEYYYHANVGTLNDKFFEEYEKYEYSQMNLKNQLIKEEKDKINERLNPNRSSLAISSIHNKAVLMIEVK
jgi:hypothetical protein